MTEVLNLAPGNKNIDVEYAKIKKLIKKRERSVDISKLEKVLHTQTQTLRQHQQKQTIKNKT